MPAVSMNHSLSWCFSEVFSRNMLSIRVEIMVVVVIMMIIIILITMEQLQFWVIYINIYIYITHINSFHSCGNPLR